MAELFDEIPEKLATVISILPFSTDIIDDASGRYLTPIGSLIMIAYDSIINGIVEIGDTVLSVAVSPEVGTIFSLPANTIYDLDKKRKKSEYSSCNWYYLLIYAKRSKIEKIKI